MPKNRLQTRRSRLPSRLPFADTPLLSREGREKLDRPGHNVDLCAVGNLAPLSLTQFI
jgi:hypothetical protein